MVFTTENLQKISMYAIVIDSDGIGGKIAL
jgi:hypothetical protein